MSGLARRLAAKPDTGARVTRGEVVSWSGGVFTVSVSGVTLTVTAMLGSAGTLAPGDVVALSRQKSNLLLLGKIVAPS